MEFSPLFFGGLPTGTEEGGDQGCPEPLPQGMVADEAFQQLQDLCFGGCRVSGG